MTERLRARKILAAGALVLLGGNALAGCGSDQNKSNWQVGVLCPADGKVDINKVDDVQFTKSDVVISCEGNDGKKVEPQSIELLRGPGTITDDGRYNQTVNIDVRYSDAFLAEQDPSLSIEINPSAHNATLGVHGVREITGVRTQPTPAPTTTTAQR